jgi:hypothetical protein
VSGATQLEIVMGVSVCVITIFCEDQADVTPLNVMRAGKRSRKLNAKNFYDVRKASNRVGKSKNLVVARMKYATVK